MASEAAVGNYGVAVRLVETAILVPAFIGGAFLVTIAQTGPRTSRGQLQTVVASRNALLICLPMAFSLGIAADPIVEAVAGSSYKTAGTALLLLSPMVGLVATYSILANLQVANDRLGPLIWINFGGVLLKVGLNLYAIPRYGIEGAAVTAVVAEVFVVTGQWVVSRSIANMRAIFDDVWRFGVAAVTMIGTGAAAAGAQGWPLGLFAGLSSFAITGLALRCISKRDLRLALASLRPRPS
jgi:O-antigen/teichoic acid export membrane protein